MTGKIGRKKVLKFRDFPTRLHGEVFFVGKRLRVYTIVDFSFIRTFAPSF